MKPILISAKLSSVCDDICGQAMERAKQMDEEGQRINKMNIGNLAPFALSVAQRSQRVILKTA